MLNGAESKWDDSTTCDECGETLAWEDVGYCSDGGTYCQECAQALGVVLDWSDSMEARRVQRFQTPSNEIVEGESWQQAIRDLRERMVHTDPWWDGCYNWRLHEDGLHLIQITTEGGM